MLRIVVAVTSACVPAWQRWCIDPLRALEGSAVGVRVVARAGSHDRAAGATRALAGRALAPTSIALDHADPASADVLLDLAGTEGGVTAANEVWSFRLGDSDDPSLPFGREIATGARTFDIALTRRTAAGSSTLRAGRFPVTEVYPSTLRLALSQAALWPASLASVLAAGAALPSDPAPPAPRRTPLTPLESLRFGFALARGMWRAIAGELLEITEWNVGLAPGEPRRLLCGEPLDVRWFPRPETSTFIADPFVVERDGVRAMLVEAFDYRVGRGVIDALVLDDDDRVVSRVPAIDRPTHLSFPFPVEIDGALYVVPENCAANEVALYRCTRFPDRWEREAALLPGEDGVDTMLFLFEGRWWAFGTRYRQGSNVALYAHHAPAPHGPWTAHLLNPIVCDVSSARPAGRPFVVDGALYRPGQDCTASYGGGIAIARIDVLSPSAYRETIVQRFAGHRSGRWKDGFHTVDFTRGSIVVDGKHSYLDARKLTRSVPALVRRAASLLKRSSRG